LNKSVVKIIEDYKKIQIDIPIIIKNNGILMKDVYANMGLSKSTFWRKCKNMSFSYKEIILVYKIIDDKVTN